MPYDRNPKTRISYPDFIWDDGLHITETQKTAARVHRVPDDLLRSLWNRVEAGPDGEFETPGDISDSQ